MGRARRWARAVDGELVNLEVCDYVAVERESGRSYAVVAHMHGGAANWVLARYDGRDDAARVQDLLAQRLDAWRLDGRAFAEPGGDDSATAEDTAT